MRSPHEIPSDCLDAATGVLRWRFRAAPIERHLMVYDSLGSTWPVNTGVVVHQGRIYFGAGIVDHDGTFLYALNAESGEPIWENTSSGHLDPAQRKGVSAQGNLTVLGGKLVMAGGNAISPARYDLDTGRCLELARPDAAPQANGGKFVGGFPGGSLIAGGRILYSSPRNVATKGSFDLWPPAPDQPRMILSFSGVIPAWNDSLIAVVHLKYGKIVALGIDAVSDRMKSGLEPPPGRPNPISQNLVSALTGAGRERWQSRPGDRNDFEVLSLALAADAVVAVARYRNTQRALPQFLLAALDSATGDPIFQVDLQAEPLPGGLAIDRDGRILVTLLEGGLACYGLTFRG